MTQTQEKIINAIKIIILICIIGLKVAALYAGKRKE